MKPILESKSRKGIINQTISIFILVLMVVVISGFTYWFISSFKGTLATVDEQTGTVVNESVHINSTGNMLAHATDLGFAHPVITAASNNTDSTGITVLGNITVSSTGNVTNASALSWNDALISYTYGYTGGTAYGAVNDTETASLNIIDLLPFIFMALGFVIIIGVLIRILVPIMNLGNSFGGGGF